MPKTAKAEDLLTPQKVADILSISRQHLNRISKSGVLLPWYRDDKYTLYHRKDVDKIVRERSQ